MNCRCLLYVLALPFLGAPASLAQGSDAAPAAAADLETLWADATLWQVGSNAEKVPAARLALIAEGERALEFIIPDKLDSSSTLVSRAFNSVIRGLHAQVEERKFERTPVERLRVCLSSTKGSVRRNAAELLSLLGDADSAAAIAGLLDDEEAQRGALSALSRLGATETVPHIAALLRSDAKERVRCAAVVALASLKTEQSTQALIDTLSSSGSALRFAAQFALEKQEAVADLRRTLHANNRRARIHALMALGRIGDESARGAIRSLLRDRDPVLRGHAVKALAGIATESDEVAFRKMARTEADPFVQTALREALE